MRILFSILVITLAILCAWAIPAWASPQYYQVLMAEAVSEGELGMMAVACVIRNRNGNLSGFYGAKRADLDDFCQRQGKKWIDIAKKIEKNYIWGDMPDITFGATHYEAIEKYGIPYWAKDMVVTIKIGDHTFYKKK